MNFVDKRIIDKEINESQEFKKKMDMIRKKGKNMCAFVSFYENGGGKIYTYLVDAYYHGGRWFIEDTDKQVYVMEFGELKDSELPVPKEKMKHLRWEEEPIDNIQEESSSYIFDDEPDEEWIINTSLFPDNNIDIFIRIDKYLGIRFPGFEKSSSFDIFGDYYLYIYEMDDKVICLEFELWTGITLKSNFIFDVPDFKNEKVYEKYLGELTKEQVDDMIEKLQKKYTTLKLELAHNPDDLFDIENKELDYWLYDINNYIKIGHKIEDGKNITYIASNISDLLKEGCDYI